MLQTRTIKTPDVSFTIHNNDCINVLKTLIYNGVKINTVITDLPYFQVVKNDWDNVWKTEDEYIQWVRECIDLLSQCLAKNANIILFTSRQYNRKLCNILDEYFQEKRIIIWARKRMMNNTRGKSLSSGYEPICYYSKGDSPIFNMVKIKPTTKRKEYTEGLLKDGVNLSDVWSDIPSIPHNSKEKVNHPTQKPLTLMKRCVELFSNDGDTILDFTMGSGTTGVASIELGRNFIGVEKNIDYFRIALQRLENTIKPNTKGEE